MKNSNLLKVITTMLIICFVFSIWAQKTKSDYVKEAKEKAADKTSKKIITQDSKIPEVKARNGVIDGDSDGPYALTEEEITHIKSNKDIILCGKTGEIKESKLWRKTDLPKHKKTGFNVTSLRQELIDAHTASAKAGKPLFTEEEIALLKSKKDIAICPKNGEIKGSKEYSKTGCEKCPKCNLNMYSPLYILRLRHNLIDEKKYQKKVKDIKKEQDGKK